MTTKRKTVHTNGTARNGHIHQNGSATAVKTPPKSRDENSVNTWDIVKVFLPTFGFIFGGCCSNVYALETLINTSPSAGTIITALQFLLTSLITLPANIDARSSSPWRLRERQIPLRSWLIYTTFFLSINILNNMAFSYHISIPLHIILRSAGPVTTMLVFYFCSGKRYPQLKVFAVLLLFVGVVVAAVSDAYSKTPEAFEASLSSVETEPPWSRLALKCLPSGGALREQGPGFALLASALTLSSFMGLYSDNMYSQYGRNEAVSSESLFYSHTLSLPFFAVQAKTLNHSLASLIKGSVPLSTSLATGMFPKPASFLESTPSAVPMLLINAVTQYICIKGVNQLSAKSSSLTVSIVLNIRKLVSLLLSIWLFGNQLAPGVVIGAALVFLGGGLYAVPSGSAGKSRSSEKLREKKVR